MKPSKKTGSKTVQHARPPAGKAKPVTLKPLFIGVSAIAVVALIVFSPCLGAEFLGWDDYNYIRDNDLIRSLSWASVMHIFNYKTIVVGNYHPLTILTYALEYRVAGLNPFLFHLDNLLLHLFNIALFAWLMWLLTKKRYATLIAAALFALHPMRTESVVWAAERKDVLYAFFFLLSLICYVYFVVKDHRNYRYYLLSLGLFILSILSKGQAVVLPLTLFLVDYWFAKKITVRSLLLKAPYFLVSLASGILAIVAQHSSLTVQRLQEHTFAGRIVIAAFNIVAYLYKLVYPFNLSCFYKYPATGDMGWIYAGAVGAVLLIVFMAVYFRKNRTVVFGSLFFLFTLSIVTQILPVGNAIIADRYTYIPYIGLFFMAGMLFDPFIMAKGRNSWYFLAIPLAILAVFSIKSYQYATTWHSNVTLWENALRQDPDNGVAYTDLAHYYIEKEDYATAIPLLKKAIENEATFVECFNAYQNLGVACSRTGHDDEAVKNFTSALSRRPAYVDALMNRGLSYTSMGKYDSAAADFTTILKTMDSLNVKAWYSRGIAWNKMNMPDRAIADYNTAIRINPGFQGPRVNRGNISFMRNQFDAAIADYNVALQLDPADGATFLNRSFSYFKLGRYTEALRDAMKAKELKTAVNPNYINDLEKGARR